MLPDRLAYFISDILHHLDLIAIMKRYGDEERGYPPYHPRMMLKVLLYASCLRLPSSRKIENRFQEDIAFRVPSANNTPDFQTISDFLSDADLPSVMRITSWQRGRHAGNIYLLRYNYLDVLL